MKKQKKIGSIICLAERPPQFAEVSLCVLHSLKQLYQFLLGQNDKIENNFKRKRLFWHVSC